MIVCLSIMPEIKLPTLLCLLNKLPECTEPGTMGSDFHVCGSFVVRALCQEA